MLNEKLKKYRKAKGWTQDDLAERSGYSRSSIINWESGKRAPRTVDIEKLALVLDISPQDLMNDSQDMPKIEIPMDNWLLPQGLGTGKVGVFSYWGGVVDSAKNLVENKNLQEMQLIAPLLKMAYETLKQAIDASIEEHKSNTSEVSAYNGNNSVYSGNALTVSKATV